MKPDRPSRPESCRVPNEKGLLETTGRAERTAEVELVNAAGVVHAQVVTIVSIRRRERAART